MLHPIEPIVGEHLPISLLCQYNYPVALLGSTNVPENIICQKLHYIPCSGFFLDPLAGYCIR